MKLGCRFPIYAIFIPFTKLCLAWGLSVCFCLWELCFALGLSVCSFGELCLALGLSVCWLGELCFALGLSVGWVNYVLHWVCLLVG